MTDLAIDLVLAAIAAGGIALGLRAIVRRYARERFGALAYVDAGTGARSAIVAPGYRLRGRPDEVRRRPDGRPVPVEWKSARAPSGGPWPSHRIQLYAYCLLLEEAEGRSPPYGILRYRDGGEFVVPWTAAARDLLLRRLVELRGPYDGRASPTPAKCARCRWVDGCDARAAD